MTIQSKRTVLLLVFVTLFLTGLLLRLTIWNYGATDISNDGILFEALAEPSNMHPFGTTRLGQDVFVRTIDGLVNAAIVMILGSLLAFVFGSTLAFLSYIGGGLTDKILSILTDALYAIPSILIALAVLIGVPNDSAQRLPLVLGAAILGIVLFFGAKFFRSIRVNLAHEQQTGYYAAAIASGLSKFRIFWIHLFPNSLTGTKPLFTGAGADAILTLAGLGFIGVGISATDGADWGYDLSRGISDLAKGVWWTTLIPALAISITVLVYAYFVEGRSADDSAS